MGSLDKLTFGLVCAKTNNPVTNIKMESLNLSILIGFSKHYYRIRVMCPLNEWVLSKSSFTVIR